MNHEAVMLESRTMRGSLVGRTEALDKVKALRLLPDGVHITVQLVADYFDVDEEAVNSVVRRHRDELMTNGMSLLKGPDLQDFLAVNMTTRRSPGRGLLVLPRRAVLNVAMLLRDSEVARDVRRHLLDLAEPVARARAGWPEAMVAEIVERAVAVVRAELVAVRAELDELRKAHAALARQLELERGLVGAMSSRVADTACEVRTLGGRVDMLCTLVAVPGRRRGPYARGLR